MQKKLLILKFILGVGTVFWGSRSIRIKTPGLQRLQGKERMRDVSGGLTFHHIVQLLSDRLRDTLWSQQQEFLLDQR